MKHHAFKRDSSPKKIPPERIWREKIAPFYESGHTMEEVCRAFRMDMLTLRRELPKYTPIRPPGPRPGFRRKPYGHYPKEEVTPNEPDTSSTKPRAKPFHIGAFEKSVVRDDIQLENPVKTTKKKRRIIPV